MLGVFFMAFPLAALAERYRTVWPAVVAHAVPFTAVTVVVTQPAGTLEFWGFTAVVGALSLVATAVIRPRDPRQRAAASSNGQLTPAISSHAAHNRPATSAERVSFAARARRGVPRKNPFGP